MDRVYDESEDKVNIPRMVNFLMFCCASAVAAGLILYDRLVGMSSDHYWRYTGAAMVTVLATIMIEFRHHDSPIQPGRPRRRGFDVVLKKDKP